MAYRFFILPSAWLICDPFTLLLSSFLFSLFKAEKKEDTWHVLGGKATQKTCCFIFAQLTDFSCEKTKFKEIYIFVLRAPEISANN